MTLDCALLSGIPCTRDGATQAFLNPRTGSFAEEWLQSSSAVNAEMHLVDKYLTGIPNTWSQIAVGLSALGVRTIANATVADLEQALAEFSVVAILAHHVQGDGGQTVGIEMSDTVVEPRTICAMSATSPQVVHLGVCRSANTLAAPFKSRCSSVRVIGSQSQIEPQFFLRTFGMTVKLWRQEGGDYVDAFIKLRTAMLDSFFVPP